MRKNFKLFLLFIFAPLLIILFTGCGYKPSAHYTKNVVGETVSTEVVISMQDPENTVIIKDALDSAVIMRFRSSLRDRGHAKTHLRISLGTVHFVPIQYDANGYVSTYRTTVRLNIVRKTEGVSKNYSVKGTYDFSIEPNAIISDQARFDAIRFSSAKAIDSFIAKVSAEGTRSQEKSNDKPDN